MVHLKNKNLLALFNNFMSSSFNSLVNSAHGMIAMSDYVESLPEHAALEFLKGKLSGVPNEEDARDKVGDIIQNKTANNSVDQFWMYFHWNVLPEDSKKLIVEELKENLDMLIENKLHGILLYCKIFDYVELKDKTKMLKKCISKKIDELIRKNPNSLFLFVKVINSYDDSCNIGNILYNDIVSNILGFIENQTTVTFLFYILCENFEKEFSVKYHPK